jgi:allantoate deiminase
MLTSKALAGVLDHVPDMADAQWGELARRWANGAWRPRACWPRGIPARWPISKRISSRGRCWKPRGWRWAWSPALPRNCAMKWWCGLAGHAGTCAMPLRRDALAGAAEMILAIERIAGADASDLVATVGRIEALPGAANVIAGECASPSTCAPARPRGATGPPRRSWPKSPPSPRGAGWC